MLRSSYGAVRLVILRLGEKQLPGHFSFSCLSSSLPDCRNLAVVAIFSCSAGALMNARARKEGFPTHTDLLHPYFDPTLPRRFIIYLPSMIVDAGPLCNDAVAVPLKRSLHGSSR